MITIGHWHFGADTGDKGRKWVAAMNGIANLLPEPVRRMTWRFDGTVEDFLLKYTAATGKMALVSRVDDSWVVYVTDKSSFGQYG